jgi:hypothetical protein
MPESFDVKEKTGAQYTTTMKDADGTAIPLANISTIKLTLYNYADGSAINSRTTQDVKGANNVTIHDTSGLLTWAIQANDNPIVSSDIPVGDKETHIALFEIAYTGNGAPGKHEVYLLVKYLGKVS